MRGSHDKFLILGIDLAAEAASLRAMHLSARSVVLGLALCGTLFASACTTGPEKKAAIIPPAMTDETTTQPAMATYSCADGGMMTIENFGSSVRITGASDQPIELPASPATQRTRYGEQPYALVVEGRDALFMKSGDEPLTCTR